jgi:5-methyltetrahydrofolate--homocysteine methyltransferase
MTRPALLEALAARTLLSDGAMGTQLQLAGLEPGGCGEAWNVDHRERILTIQRAYVEAGADCLTSNTFGASRVMLDRHGQGDRVVEINVAAVEIARQALAGREGWVLGGIGPFGGMLEPWGDVPPERVEAAFGEQAEALIGAGADAIIIETQTALEELEIGVVAAQRAGAPCIIASMAFDIMRDGDEVRTMMGVSPEQAAASMAETGVHVAALNCGTGIGMQQAADTVRRYRTACDLPTMAQPNAGQPTLEALEVVYRQTPAEMVDGLDLLLLAGARIVGGCCGSTPDHIRQFRALLDRRSSAEEDEE